MKRVIIVGGGFSGCAAAIAAAKTGAEVILLERTDMLLAGGNRAGHVNSGAGIVAARELKEMGGGEIYGALESIRLHSLREPDSEHTFIYNCALAEEKIRQVVKSFGINLRFECRAVNVVKENSVLRAIFLDAKEELEGSVFIDCTGTSGGMDICTKYGKGCVMCSSFRCPVFGNRVSIASKAGAPELAQERSDGTPGLLSLAVCINKESLKPDLKAQIEEQGVVKIRLPKEFIDYSKMYLMANVSTREDMEYANLSDIGSFAKCSRLGFLSLDKLRKVPGFETAMIEDPLGGGIYAFVKEVGIHLRDNALRVNGFKNLYIGGEKIGPIGGVDVSIITGYIAGYNAARTAAGLEPFSLPTKTLIGDFINYTGEIMKTQEGLNKLCRMSGGLYFDRIKQLGFHTPDPVIIRKRIEELGLLGVLNKKLF